MNIELGAMIIEPGAMCIEPAWMLKRFCPFGRRLGCWRKENRKENLQDDDEEKLLLM